MPSTEEKKKRLRKKFKTISAILKLFVLLIILIGVPLYIYFFQYDIIEQFSTLEQVEAFFREYKTQSIFIYIALQIIQIIICVIPGQALQFAAGYMYGFWMGYLWSFVGAFLGTVITYYLAKILGHDAMHMIFGEKKIHDLLMKFNSKKADLSVLSYTGTSKGSMQLCGRLVGNEAQGVPYNLPYRKNSCNDGQFTHRKAREHRRVHSCDSDRRTGSRTVFTGSDIQKASAELDRHGIRQAYKALNLRSTCA